MTAHRLLSLVVVVLGSLFVGFEAAARSPRRIVVLADGTGSGDTSEALRAMLSGQWALGDSHVFLRNLSLERDEPRILDGLDSGRRSAVIADLRRVATAQGDDLVVIVDVKSERAERRARVAVIGLRGEPLEATTLLHPKHHAEVDARRIHSEVGVLMAAMGELDSSYTDDRTLVGRAPASPDPGAVVDEDASASPLQRAWHGHTVDEALFVVAPTLSLGSRSFDYVERVTPDQREYVIGAVPLAGISAEVYPFSGTASVARGLGLTGHWDSAIGLASRLQPSSTSALATPDGKLGTSWSNLDVGARWRLALGERWRFAGRAGYGFVDYAVAAGAAPLRGLPNVKYEFIRAGADLRVGVWFLAFIASADYLVVTTTGALGERYPRASVGGLDLMAGIAVPFARHFEARSGLRYERFFHRMNPAVGDQNVAGGALDEIARWDSSVQFYY